MGCYVDDHNLPLPPLDEEDCLFHSVAERSLSPDKAFEFKKSEGSLKMFTGNIYPVH